MAFAVPSRSARTLALVAGLLATPAIAGGPVIVPVEPEPVPAAPMMAEAYDWTGVYVGLFGTSVSGTNTWVDNSPSTANPGDWSGTLPGVELGYDWQRGHLVLGLGLAVTSGNFDATGTTNTINCGTGCSTDIDGLKTLYARVGLAMNRTLIYAVAGASSADAHGTSDGFVTDVSDTLNGTTFGVGLEQAIGKRLSVSLEYLQTDLGTLDFGAACGFECHTDVKFNQFKLGLNFRW